MGVNEDRVSYIVENNVLDNVICRALEFRPTELAKYICGLTNNTGGYIFLGIEKQNYPMASRIIKDALNTGKIKEEKTDNQSRNNKGYIPFWA